MRGGLLGGGKNSLGGQLMGMLSSARGSSLLPLLQMLGGGKSPQLADMLQLLSALPKTAPAPAPPPAAAAADAASAEVGGEAADVGGTLSRLLADPQLLASLASMLTSAASVAGTAEAGEMTEEGYAEEDMGDDAFGEEELYAADICAECRAACPRALQLFPSYERVQLMSRTFPRY